MILRGLKDISWMGAKAMMADGNFLKSLLDFDKDGLSDKQVGCLLSSFRLAYTLYIQIVMPCTV